MLGVAVALLAAAALVLFLFDDDPAQAATPAASGQGPSTSSEDGCRLLRLDPIDDQMGPTIPGREDACRLTSTIVDTLPASPVTHPLHSSSSATPAEPGSLQGA